MQIDKSIIKALERKRCTGCGSCYNICHVDAITMEVNQDGFLHPVVDESKCIGCGKCVRSCPVLSYKNNNLVLPECFAALAEDKVRAHSSSGGVFFVLAKYILDQGGYVCGAVWNEQWGVEHIVTNNIEIVKKMRGSKYVQSNTKKVYSQIGSLLRNEHEVLFTGCPCQVAGLYQYLGNKPTNLITCDIVCHGVPSPKAFTKLLKSIVATNARVKGIRPQENKIKSVSFRDKMLHGWAHSLVVRFEDGSEFCKNKMQTTWYESFLQGLNCRQSCGECEFSKPPRTGDFTIGDFWGADEFDNTLNDGKGTSIVTLNNNRARQTFKEIKANFININKVPLEAAKVKNINLVASSREHPLRAKFFELLDYYDEYDKVVRYVLDRKFDIGYIGWWYGQNYGSCLTNFALHQYLKSLSYTVLMIEWPMRARPFPPISNSASRRFTKKYYDISIQRTYQELSQLNYHCDNFIVGSDQLWNYWSTKENGQFFFLDFVNDTKRKISYATSFGSNETVITAPSEFIAKSAFHLQRFDSVSVREDDGLNVCNDVFGVEATRLLDPVFICDKSNYENVIKQAKASENQEYILVYILSPNLAKREMLLRLKEQAKEKIILILDIQSDDYKRDKAIMDVGVTIIDNMEIEDWLYYFKNAKSVISDSYHAACFSIIFKRNFVSIANLQRGLSRFITLFKVLNLMERMIYDPLEITTKKIYLESIDYDAVDTRLNPEVLYAQNWLKEALNKRKIHNYSTYDILNERIVEIEKRFNSFATMEPKRG